MAAAVACEQYQKMGDVPGTLYARFVLGFDHFYERRDPAGSDRAQLDEAEWLLARGMITGLVARQREAMAWFPRSGRAAEPLVDCAETEGHLGEALALYQRLGDRVGEASAHLALAEVARVYGDDSGEEEHARAACDLYARLEDPRGEARARFALGGIAYRRGDDERARTELAAALSLFDDEDMRSDARWPIALARLWLAALRRPDGRRRAASALDPAVAGRLERSAEQLRVVLGERPIDDWDERWAAAAPHLILRRKDRPRRPWRARERDSDGLVAALEYLHLVAQTNGAPLVEAQLLLELAVQLRERGRVVDALAPARSAVRFHEAVRRDQVSGVIRAHFYRSRRSSYLVALGLAVAAGDAEMALEVLESSRTAVLASLLTHGVPVVPGKAGDLLRAIVRIEADLADGEATPELEQHLDDAYEALREELFVILGPALLGWRMHGSEQSDMVHARLATDLAGARATRELERLINGVAEIWRDAGRLEGLRGRLAEEISAIPVFELPPVDTAEILRTTAEHHVVLYEIAPPDVGESACVYMVWLAPGRPPEIARSELDAEALAWIEGFAAGGREARLFDPDPRRFERLGELLLPEDLRKLLLARGRERDALRLLLSPAGGLWKLPFAALRLGTGAEAALLAERASLTYVPSLGLRAALAGRDPGSAGADGALGYFNPTLPSADLQRAALATHFARLQEVGDAAELPGILAHAKEYALCVLGAHGDEQTGLSHSLDLGHGVALRAGELLFASLPAVVVLGACSSGSLALEPGDEPLGLPTAALVGGARTVLAALFPVPDRETAEILAAAYAAIARGAEPAAALREAQLAHIAGCAGRALCPPMHWAGCVAIGRG